MIDRARNVPVGVARGTGRSVLIAGLAGDDYREDNVRSESTIPSRNILEIMRLDKRGTRCFMRDIVGEKKRSVSASIRIILFDLTAMLSELILKLRKQYAMYLTIEQFSSILSNNITIENLLFGFIPTTKRRS